MKKKTLPFNTDAGRGDSEKIDLKKIIGPSIDPLDEVGDKLVKALDDEEEEDVIKPTFSDDGDDADDAYWNKDESSWDDDGDEKPAVADDDTGYKEF